MRAVIVLFVMLCAVPASGQTAPEIVDAPAADATAQRRAVAHLLSAIHELPPRAQFEKAARDPWTVVASLAAGRGPIAERAVEAMFYWPTDATFAFAEATLANPQAPRGRRHRVLLLVAETYGERATALVVPFLGDPDRQLRITAAAAVAKIRSVEAFAALDAAVAAERDSAVAAQMRRYARRILP